MVRTWWNVCLTWCESTSNPATKNTPHFENIFTLCAVLEHFVPSSTLRVKAQTADQRSRHLLRAKPQGEAPRICSGAALRQNLVGGFRLVPEGFHDQTDQRIGGGVRQ
jgi:hypothetical protein